MVWLFRNKKSRLISLVLVSIFLIIAGIYNLISAAVFKSDISSKYDKGENDINIMTGSEYRNKQNVYGDILYLYDCFCEETTTNTTYGVETSSSVTSSYFLMPITSDNEENEKYITVVIHNKDSLETMYDIVDDTYDYLDGEDVDWHDLFIMGKVKPLESDVKDYMIDWFKSAEFFESYDDVTISKYVVPYEIDEYDPDNTMEIGEILLGVGLFFGIITALVIIFTFKKADKYEAPVNPVYPGQNIYSASQYTADMQANNSPYQPVQPATQQNTYNSPVYTPKQQTQSGTYYSSYSSEFQNETPVATVASAQSTDMSDLNTSGIEFDTLDNSSDTQNENYNEMNDLNNNDVDYDSLGSYETDSYNDNIDDDTF